MTIQEKKCFLKQYRSVERKIKRMQEERSRWWDIALKITPSWSDMPKGNVSADKTQEAIDKIWELDQLIGRELARLIDIRNQIWKAIQTVPYIDLRELLEYHYIDGLTLEDSAANKMNYSFRQICRLHGRALELMSWNVT